MGVGRSLKLYFYLKHDSQCIEIIVHPSFLAKRMGPYKDYQMPKSYFLLKALLFVS